MKRPIDWREDRSAVREQVAESARCVLPIFLIVVLLCLAAAPMKPDLLLSFLIGGVMLVVGMGLFSLGAEQSMTPIGTKIGTALTRTKNLPLILGAGAGDLQAQVAGAELCAGVLQQLGKCFLRVRTVAAVIAIAQDAAFVQNNELCGG